MVYPNNPKATEQLHQYYRMKNIIEKLFSIRSEIDRVNNNLLNEYKDLIFEEVNYILKKINDI